MTALVRWMTAAVALTTSCATTTTSPPGGPEAPALPSAWTAAPASDRPTGTPHDSGALQAWRDVFVDERLAGLVADALRHNADRAVAVERVAQARAVVHGATGAMLPTVSVTGATALRRFGLFTMDGAGNATTDITPGQIVPEHLPDFLGGLQSSWELDVWGRLWNQRQASWARVLAAEEAVHLVEVNLVAALGEAWFELCELDEAVKVLEATLARQRMATESIAAQKVAGRVTELAVQQFEAEVKETEARLVDVRRQIQARERALHLLVGRLPGPLERGQVVEVAPAAVPPGVPADILRLRPDIRATALELKASGLDVRSATAAFLPSLTVNGLIGLQAFNPVYLLDPRSLAYGLVGGLVAPVLNRAAIEAEHAAATARQREVLITHHQTILTAWVEVEDALNDVRADDELFALAVARRDGRRRAAETAGLLFTAGRADWLEVLMAQSQAADAELEVIEAARARLTARVRLYRAIGGGWTTIEPEQPRFAAHPLDGLLSGPDDGG
jgi:outer membrane protein, multidrug efflux system